MRDYKKLDELNARARDLIVDIEVHAELATSFGGQSHMDIVEARYQELKKIWQEKKAEAERVEA